MFESAQRGGALDYADFHSPVLDSLFARARSAPAGPRQVAGWRAVQQLLADSMPVAWIYHSRGVQGVTARLENVVMDLRGEMVSLSRWQLETSAPAKVTRR
jgi:peptide/nickel transport system substrate-binding protein